MRQKIIDPTEVWRRWFAWRPVRVGERRVWPEHVERQLKTFGPWDEAWEYRPCPE